ncbi:unnamed protein product [Parnassius apollo]|uniref:(apollo) hypothetical protein n=1 Tax=Parnassius apollo TaxID=110799 RepID=A0A8S3X7P0_PARAO|nr:unnamed protein product [Parnassius apollo]
MDKRQLIGSATRYIAGGHAVQTVYWRKSADGRNGLVKTTKLTFLGNKGPDKIKGGEMFARVRDKYDMQNSSQCFLHCRALIST